MYNGSVDKVLDQESRVARKMKEFNCPHNHARHQDRIVQHRFRR